MMVRGLLCFGHGGADVAHTGADGDGLAGDGHHITGVKLGDDDGFALAQLGDVGAQDEFDAEGCGLVIGDAEFAGHATDFFAFAGVASFALVHGGDGCADAMAINQARQQATVDHAGIGGMLGARGVVGCAVRAIPMGADVESVGVVASASIADG